MCQLFWIVPKKEQNLSFLPVGALIERTKSNTGFYLNELMSFQSQQILILEKNIFKALNSVGKIEQ